MKPTTYTKLFKETKASHETLQRVLQKLQQHNLIRRLGYDHKVGYIITEKGVKGFIYINELYNFLEQ